MYLKEVIDFVEDAIVDFAKREGFSSAIMSVHQSNTSTNYSRRASQIHKDLRFRKAGEYKKVYSELFDKNGLLNE